MMETPYTERSETMGEEKNVLLTVVHKDEDTQDELVLDFSAIWERFKRMLVIWLCLAVGIGSLSGGAAMVLQRVILKKEARALIQFSTAQAYDVNKIKSTAVVQDALNASGIPITRLNVFQNAVNIQGVIPNGAYERMSMYYNMLSPNNPDTTILDTLLNAQYQISRYVISFNYSAADLNREDGINFLNELLRAYQDYCAFNYNYNTPVGNALSAVDYHDYDYAEAADIFSRTLSNISDYLSNLNQGAGASFRSTETGFTFRDLSRIASLLRDIDLDRLSSYIVIHSVSSYDAETEISYYQWLIEDLTRQRAIERTRLASLTDSIDSYEKDSVIIFTGPDDSMVANSNDVNANYDAMITEKLSTQSRISSYTRSISYYERVIEGFQKSGASSNPEDIERVEQYLETLNESVNQLVGNISRTANEYYKIVAFSSQAKTLVPATAKGVSLISRLTIKIVFAVEALLFMCYAGAACFYGIRDANLSRKKQEEKASL